MEFGGAQRRQLICKDTLNFFGCALAQLPATFGLEDRCRDKPFFPYAYCRQENMDVERADGLPPAEAYEPDGMMPTQRAAFLRWYAQQPVRPFLLRRELLRYCANGKYIHFCGVLRASDSTFLLRRAYSARGNATFS